MFRVFLARGFYGCHANSLTNHPTSHFNLLTGEVARLLLSCLIQAIDAFVIAIGQNEFATALDAHERAFLGVHASHMSQAATGVADVADNRRFLGGVIVCVLRYA